MVVVVDAVIMSMLAETASVSCDCYLLCGPIVCVQEREIVKL